MALEDRAAVDEQSVGKEVEPAARGNPGIKLPHRSGSGIAGIGELREALLFLFFIHAQEGRGGHDQLTSNLEGCGQAGLLQLPWRDVQGNTADGADIGGDVFALDTVAAGDALREAPSGETQ